MKKKMLLSLTFKAGIAFCLLLVLAVPVMTGCGSDDAITSSSGNYSTSTDFSLSSPAFSDGGTLPRIYTCDSTGYSPPLAWTKAPAGTAGFALMMTTMALDGTKWNWVLYNIPDSLASVAENTTAGIAGRSSDGPELRYYPPCSQGPGAKLYTFTLYALSGSPVFSVPADSVTGPVLAAAIRGMILDSCLINVSYTRDSAKASLTPQQARDIAFRCSCRQQPLQIGR